MRTIRRKRYKSNKQYEYVDKFDGGLNLFISDVKLKKNESPDLLNVEPDEDGIIQTRYGYSKFGNSTGSRIRGLGFFKKDDGNRHLLCFDGSTALKEYNISTESWDSVSGFTYTANLQSDFCQGGNKMFIQNGTDALTYADGSVVASQTNGQTGSFSIFFNGALVTSGDSNNPHRIYISGAGSNVGDFSAGNGGQFVDVARSDGNFVTGLSKYATGTGNILLIHKGRATYKMTFDDTGLPTIETVSPTRGAVCHRSLDNMEDDIVMLTNDGLVMKQGAQENFFDSIRTNELSLFINPELETINKTRLDQVAGIYVKHRYYLAYSESGQTYNNKILMFDRRYNSWWKWDNINANCFCIYEDSLGAEHFIFGADNAGQVYEFDLSRDDDGVAINSYFTTCAFDFKKFDVEKYIQYFNALFRNIKGSLTITATLDGEDVAKTATIGTTQPLSGIGATLIGDFMFADDSSDETISQEVVSRPKRVMLRKKAKNIKIKFATNAVGEYFSLLQLSLAYKYKSPRRFDADDIIR